MGEKEGVGNGGETTCRNPCAGAVKPKGVRDFIENQRWPKRPPRGAEGRNAAGACDVQKGPAKDVRGKRHTRIYLG